MIKNLLFTSVSILIMSCGGSTSDEALKYGFKKGAATDSLEAVKAKILADSILSERIIGQLEDAEKYVSNFNLKDHEGLQASHYIEECMEMQKKAGVAIGLESDENPEISKRAKALTKKMKGLAIRVMPVMRERWAKAVDQKMWENNIDVKSLGNGQRTLQFTGGTFASNANIKTVQEGLTDALRILKFKRVNYKWYSGDEEYTYYDLDSAADGDF